MDTRGVVGKSVGGVVVCAGDAPSRGFHVRRSTAGPRADGATGFGGTALAVGAVPVGRSGERVALRRGVGRLCGATMAAAPGPVSSSMNHFSCWRTMYTQCPLTMSPSVFTKAGIHT